MVDQYAVIGNPIRHSKSPFIHAAFAESTGQRLEYGALEASVGAFAAAVDGFRARGGRGLNITTPFKLDAFGYATVLHERARSAGAVNCLKFEGDRVEADNFDGVGLLRDITDNLAAPVAGRTILILGAGGAARGALQPFAAAKPARLVVANRTGEKAGGLAAAYPGVEACDLTELERLGRFDIVINATSASLLGDRLEIPAAVFGLGCLSYDMTYGKGMTPFLRTAQQAGVERLHDGVGMLAEQAAEAFSWWRGVRPDTRRVIEQLTVKLA